jgi:hypothetical protein
MKMPIRILPLAFLCALGAATSARADAESPDFVSESETQLKAADAQPVRLLLAVGEERTYDLDFSPNSGPNGVSIGNPTVLATTLVRIAGHPEQLVIRPLRSGRTSVSIRTADGELKLRIEAEVAATNVFKIESEVRAALTPLTGLSVRRIGPLVHVRGSVLSPEEAGQLFEVVSQKRYAPYVVNLAVLAPQFFAGVAGKAQNEIAKFAPKIRARAVGEEIWLEGEAENLDQANRAERVANLLLPEALPASPLASDPKARHLTPRSSVQNMMTIAKAH